MWHIQRTFPGWLESVKLLPDEAAIKATEDYQLFNDVKRINPNLFTMHRMVRDSWQVYTGKPDSGWFDWEEAKRLSRLWFNAFVDGSFIESVAPVCNAVSWHNEIWDNSQNEIEVAERVAASEAAIYVWNS